MFPIVYLSTCKIAVLANDNGQQNLFGICRLFVLHYINYIQDLTALGLFFDRCDKCVFKDECRCVYAKNTHFYFTNGMWSISLS